MTIDERQPLPAAVAPPVDVARPKPSRSVEVRLSLVLFVERAAPWVLTMLRPLAVRITVWSSRSVRRNARSNARFIFGRELSAAEARAFARGVIGSFYDFVADVGRG